MSPTCASVNHLVASWPGRKAGVQVTFHSHFFPGSWKNLPQTWQVNILMVGGREPGVPERVLDLEPEDLDLGWWLVGNRLNDLRLLLRLGTDFVKYILVQLGIRTSFRLCLEL